MAKYYTTQNPRILSVKKITFCFPVAKGSDEVAPGEKNP
jgi:hypothetical protein